MKISEILQQPPNREHGLSHGELLDICGFKVANVLDKVTHVWKNLPEAAQMGLFGTGITLGASGLGAMGGTGIKLLAENPDRTDTMAGHAALGGGLGFLGGGAAGAGLGALASLLSRGRLGMGKAIPGGVVAGAVPGLMAGSIIGAGKGDQAYQSRS